MKLEFWRVLLALRVKKHFVSFTQVIVDKIKLCSIKQLH